MSESSSTNFKSLSSCIEISAPEINQGAVLKHSCPENLNIAQIEMEKIEKTINSCVFITQLPLKMTLIWSQSNFYTETTSPSHPPPPPPFPSDYKCTFSAISRKVVGKNVPRQSRKVISDMLNTLFLTLWLSNLLFVTFP